MEHILYEMDQADPYTFDDLENLAVLWEDTNPEEEETTQWLN